MWTKAQSRLPKMKTVIICSSPSVTSYHLQTSLLYLQPPQAFLTCALQQWLNETPTITYQQQMQMPASCAAKHTDYHVVSLDNGSLEYILELILRNWPTVIVFWIFDYRCKPQKMLGHEMGANLLQRLQSQNLLKCFLFIIISFKAHFLHCV